MRLDILAIGVHPDDIELSCGGTLLAHIAKGDKVGICDLTQGELGTRGSAKLRLKEAEKARKMMKAKVRENLGMKDGFFQHTPQNIKKIIKVIRKYKPRIVLANAIEDRHPDHGRAAKLIADACYYSGLEKIKTGQEKWRPEAVYHYVQDYNIPPDFVFDITDHIDEKMKVIMAFKSQFYDPKNKKENTPISSAQFMDFMKAKGRVYGRPAGFEFGEGYTVNRWIGTQDLFDLK
jgi:bacillithiol biosynthesis deacetylase BshB1